MEPTVSYTGPHGYSRRPDIHHSKINFNVILPSTPISQMALQDFLIHFLTHSDAWELTLIWE
jgi:hypothetical protein